MKKWFWLVVMTLLVGGCKSLTHPPAEKEEKPAFNSQAPNGEGNLFQ